MEDLLQHRREKDRFFATSPHSPLPPDARQGFTGLRYYDPDPTMAVAAPVHAPSDPEPFTIHTSTGDAQVWRRWGVLTFAAGGDTTTLTLLQREGQESLFLPIRPGATSTSNRPRWTGPRGRCTSTSTSPTTRPAPTTTGSPARSRRPRTG